MVNKRYVSAKTAIHQKLWKKIPPQTCWDQQYGDAKQYIQTLFVGILKYVKTRNVSEEHGYSQ